MSATRRSMTFALAAAAFLAAARAQDDRPAVIPVGLYGELRDLILPGSELEPIPLETRTEVVLRIVAVRPHGDAFRYDIDYYGLVAGEFELRDFLRRVDGSAVTDFPSVPLRFEAALPAATLKPNAVGEGKLPRVGGYKAILIAAGIVWLLGLLALIFVGRKRARVGADADAPPPTFAERLRPLVAAARDGELNGEQSAELERSLYGFWRERLDLADESPATALEKLRKHEQAAPLLQQLERWLHAPNPESPADLDALLEPYAREQQA